MNAITRPQIYLSRLYSFTAKSQVKRLHQLYNNGKLDTPVSALIPGTRPFVCGILQKPIFLAKSSLPLATQPSIPPLTRCQGYHSSAVQKKSLLERFKEGIGMRKKMRYSGQIMRRSGLRLYLSCVELVDYDEFFSVFQLPDTYNSWFRITELHIWMAMIRLHSEGEEGKIIRNNMLRGMWEDVEKRTKKLGSAASSSGRATGISELNGQFHASIFAYDEGLLSDDKVLAGAVWRNFFEMQCEDAEKIALMVGYIRKQMQHIDNQETEQVLERGIMTFLPLFGEQLSSTKSKMVEDICTRT